MLERMALLGLHSCRWNQSDPPRASHWNTRLGVGLGIDGYSCHSTPSKSYPQMVYLTTLGDYISPCCPCALPNPSPVTCCLAFPCSLPPKFRFHRSSKTSPPTANNSIWHYRNWPMAASSQMSPLNFQPKSLSGGVHLWAVLNWSAPG